MIKYPNGITQEKKNNHHISSAANRGMDLEHDINVSNEYYREHDLAIITKRPTPINVVKVNYSKMEIISAYFEEQSTTDYNGIYRGKYLDFEAKSTNCRTSIPLTNITKHQIEHLKGVIHHGGIAFFIISFVSRNEVFLLDAKFVIDFYESPKRKSIPYDDIKENGSLIKQGFNPRLYYLDNVDSVYF